jgi:hypothetical protein
VEELANKNGTPDLRVAGAPGVEANTITLQNPTDAPVEFKLSRLNSPFQVVTVVDAHNDYNIVLPTLPYTVIARIKGKVAASVSFTDPDSHITAAPSHNDSGVTLIVH